MKKHYSWSPFHNTIPHHTQKPLSATFSSPLGIGKLRQTRLKLLNPKEHFTNPPTTTTPALAEILGSVGIFKDDTEPFQPLPWLAGTKSIPYPTALHMSIRIQLKRFLMTIRQAMSLSH